MKPFILEFIAMMYDCPLHLKVIALAQTIVRLAITGPFILGGKMRYSYFATVNQKGANAPNSKLTEEQAIEIKRLMGTKMRRKLIARQFNVCLKTLHDIKSGKRWGHLQEQRLDCISPNL
jgi:hypothetical protein